MKNIPKEIHLNLGSEPLDEDVDFQDLSEVTWSKEKIYPNDIRYVLSEDNNRGCPCLYLEEPCQPYCTCPQGLYSHGCLYCCNYGSLEQRQEKAKLLVTKLREKD